MFNSQTAFNNLYAAPKFKELLPTDQITQTQVMPDGTSINTNESGKIVFVEYSSGIKVKRNDKFTMVALLDGSYMMGSESFALLRLD